MQLNKQPIFLFFKAMTVVYMFNFSVSIGGILFFVLRLLCEKKHLLQ